MTMKDGMKQIAYSAVDAVDTLAKKLIDGGVEPKAAIDAAAILTKGKLDEYLDKHFGCLSASEITSNLSSQNAPRIQ